MKTCDTLCGRYTTGQQNTIKERIYLIPMPNVDVLINKLRNVYHFSHYSQLLGIFIHLIPLDEHMLHAIRDLNGLS